MKGEIRLICQECLIQCRNIQRKNMKMQAILYQKQFKHTTVPYVERSYK